MKYHDDKNGPKYFFLVVVVLFLYLAFFQFNIQTAYTYTVTQAAEFLHSFGL